jgi:hypothetical protein
MSTNQIKRLHTLLQQRHTDPSWLRENSRDRRKTADHLSRQLDWDGRDSPLPETAVGSSRQNRDESLNPKPSTFADKDAIKWNRHKSSGTFITEKPGSHVSDVEQENMVLRRQVEVLMGQIAAGQRKLPQLNLSKIPRPPSGNPPLSSDHCNRFSRHEHTRDHSPGSNSPQPDCMRSSGSQTDRPLKSSTIHAANVKVLARPVRGTSADSRDSVQRRVSHRFHGRQISTPLSSECHQDRTMSSHGHHHERKIVSLQQEVNTLQSKHKVAQEKLWGLEECLSAKDAELAIKEAELKHLRFLIGVKEGNEAQVERHLAYLQGVRSEDFIVNPEDNIAEAGKFTLRQIDADIYRFEENLKEYEEHLRAGDEEALEGQRLLTAIDDEKVRRQGNLTAMKGNHQGNQGDQGENDEYVGPNGERLHIGCSDCGRVVIVADKEIDCQLLDDSMIQELDKDRKEQTGQPDVVADQQKKKKKPVRRFVGIDPPYDTIVKDPTRWFKERDVRRTTLTEKKILEAATNIITEKIIADMVDDMAGSSRGEMPYVVYEYFLGKFGVRTLADFYLLELIEGLKMFHQNNPRIGAPAKYTINMYLNTYMP